MNEMLLGNSYIDLMIVISGLIGISSLTISFFGSVIAAEMLLARNRSWITRWRIFVITSVLAFLLVHAILRVSKYLPDVNSSNSMIMDLSKISFYSLFICHIATSLSIVIGVAGLAVVWIKTRLSSK